MCVPGAIAATSAAIVRMNPADAARAPDGPMKIATGVRAAIMCETIVSVDSRSPPGVKRFSFELSQQRGLRTIGLIESVDHVLRRYRVDDAVNDG